MTFFFFFASHRVCWAATAALTFGVFLRGRVLVAGSLDLVQPVDKPLKGGLGILRHRRRRGRRLACRGCGRGRGATDGHAVHERLPQGLCGGEAERFEDLDIQYKQETGQNKEGLAAGCFDFGFGFAIQCVRPVHGIKRGRWGAIRNVPT